MKIKILFFTSLFILVALDYALSQALLKAEVDKTKITTDETLTYKLIITSSETKISQPILPKFEGFRILSNAQSSTISFLKGQAKTILVYTYILAPQEIGKFKIGPSHIKIRDKVYTSTAFEIEIKEGKRNKGLPPATKKEQTTL